MRISVIKLAVVVLALFVSGCKETLYSNLSEREANEMVAVLASSGIAADRVAGADNLYMIKIAQGSLPASIAILQRHGLPRPQFGSIGEVFDGQGIVGSTFEENARYAWALGQELSHTLSHIDGVSQARVHVVLHPKARLDRTSLPSTASVLIEHYPEFPIETAVADVKTLVTHAVPDLSIENVSVSLFTAAVPTVTVPQALSAEASGVRGMLMGGQGSVNSNILAIIIAVFGVALLLAFFRDRSRKSNKSA